jgi:hypothetical protein
MSHKIKIANKPSFNGVHVWYSEIENAILICANTELWDIRLESDKKQAHISLKK